MQHRVALVEYHLSGLHCDVVRLARVVIHLDGPRLVHVLGHLDDARRHQRQTVQICVGIYVMSFTRVMSVNECVLMCMRDQIQKDTQRLETFVVAYSMTTPLHQASQHIRTQAYKHTYVLTA